MRARSIATHLRHLPRSAGLSRLPPPARPPPSLARKSPFDARTYSATQSQPSDAAGQPEVAGAAGGDASKRSTEFEAFKEQAEQTEASLREKIKEQEVGPPIPSFLPNTHG